MSTIYRAYHNESDFQKYRIFTVHITGLVLLTAAPFASSLFDLCPGFLRST